MNKEGLKMSEMRWCPTCETNRDTNMKINWIIFIILLILGIILGLIYLLYCYLEKQQCVVCGTPKGRMEMMRPGEKLN
ncbi:MAG: hypothetical protein FWG19_02900 [Methanomassiliicoccaceae archaeon]|nr:hypothetical protein [Methanomassiliicoccaceae archaeon]